MQCLSENYARDAYNILAQSESRVHTVTTNSLGKNNNKLPNIHKCCFLKKMLDVK